MVDSSSLFNIDELKKTLWSSYSYITNHYEELRNTWDVAPVFIQQLWNGNRNNIDKQVYDIIHTYHLEPDETVWDKGYDEIELWDIVNAFFDDVCEDLYDKVGLPEIDTYHYWFYTSFNPDNGIYTLYMGVAPYATIEL